MKKPGCKRFFTKADALWHEVYRQLQQVLLRLEKKHPGIYNSILKTKEPHIILRFLRYDIQTLASFWPSPL
ncbi:MAG: hypothetical protein H6925_00310 [Holosporaceae bacterium]|nr:MAG: hypothetical protein H6925_00310 [Holosporaceae bacterium]